jgi:hypothetical protein
MSQGPTGNQGARGLAGIQGPRGPVGPVATSNQNGVQGDFEVVGDLNVVGTVTGVTKSMVGLGAVDNTSDANKPVSTAAQTALDAKADKTTVTADISTAVNSLVNGAPELLNTLGELSAALNADESAAASLATLVASKAPLASPAFTGSLSAADGKMVVDVSGNMVISGKISSTLNDDPFCMPYPQGQYAVQRLEFCNMHAQVECACPWSESTLVGSIADPTFYGTDTSSYVQAVPLNDSSFNFDTSGVKFPGNFYFLDPVTQLKPCSAPVPQTYTVYAPVKGEKTKQDYFSPSLNAGTFNLDDFMLAQMWYNSGYGINNTYGNNYYLTIDMDVDIGPNSLYRLFKAYDFTTLSDLSGYMYSTTGKTYLKNIQDLQISCTPGTPGTIFQTLVRYIIGLLTKGVGASYRFSPLSSATKSALYALVQSSDNYKNIKKYKTWSGHSPCSDILDTSGYIYKTTFDFTTLAKAKCPIVLMTEITASTCLGNNYLAEYLASTGIMVVCVASMYTNAIIRRTAGASSLTALQLAQNNNFKNYIGSNGSYGYFAVNNTHRAFKTYGSLTPPSGGVVGMAMGNFIYNIRKADSEWGIDSIQTNISMLLGIFDTLKKVKSTTSSGSLGDYIDFMSIGNNGFSGSTAPGAALNAMATDPRYNTQYMGKAIRIGNGMMLLPFDNLDYLGVDVNVVAQPLLPAGSVADRWYPNGFQIPSLIQINESDSYTGARTGCGMRKFVKEALHKSSYSARLNSVLAETWGEYHLVNNALGNFGGSLESIIGIPSATGTKHISPGFPNYDDQLFSVSKLSKQEFSTYFAYNLAELIVRFFESQLLKTTGIETIMSLPFNLQISPWEVESADDYNWPNQRFDMEVGGGGTLTVPYQKNQVELRLKNNEAIFTAGTDLSGNNPVITIGGTTGAFTNTNLKVNGSISVNGTSVATTTTVTSEVTRALAAEKMLNDQKLLFPSKTVYADQAQMSSPPQSLVNAYGVKGWYYKNTLTDTVNKKINWYMPTVGMKVSDITELYLDMFNGDNISTFNMPWIKVYSVPIEHADTAGQWANRSARTYTHDVDTVTANTYYKKANMIKRVDATNDKGLFGDNEKVFLIAVSTSSPAEQGAIEFCISKFGIVTTNNNVQELVFTGTFNGNNVVSLTDADLFKLMAMLSNYTTPV